MLSLRHLKVFQTAAEAGSFTAAAQRLYITQSAVSHAIRELEELTGAPLFDRLAKTVRLTSCGQRLLEEAAPLLSAASSLEQRLGRLELQAPLHIVSSITIASFWLPQILLDFQKKMPLVPVYVQVVPAAQAATILLDGRADLAFVEGAQPCGPFCSAVFSSYRLQAVCAPGLLPQGGELTPEQLCSQPLLLREPGSAIRDTLDSQLLLLGCTARPLWESVNSTALLQAARAGLGIAVLPQDLVQEPLEKGELAALKISGLSLQNSLIALRHREKHLSPALQAFWQCIPQGGAAAAGKG